MRKYLKIWAFVLVLSAAMPAKADIEGVSAALEVVSNAKTKAEEIQNEYRKLLDIKSLAMQTVSEINEGINKIKDVTKNPLGAVQTSVFEGLKGKVDGSGEAGVIVEDVKGNYSRVYGAENAISTAKELNKSINSLLGENAAILYARALILRQELLEEEDPDDNLETIESALKASSKMMVQSSRRWNKILEMQAYINEFKSTPGVQGFTLDEEAE